MGWRLKARLSGYERYGWSWGCARVPRRRGDLLHQEDIRLWIAVALLGVVELQYTTYHSPEPIFCNIVPWIFLEHDAC
jgi:hypothetical protein